MLNKKLVQSKLVMTNRYIEDLESILKSSFGMLRRSSRDLRAAERDFQLIVDTAIDINIQLILAAREKPPENNFQSFIELGRLCMLPKHLAQRLAPATGLRNRLVHRYEETNERLFYNSAKKFIPLFKNYQTEVFKLVKNKL